MKDHMDRIRVLHVTLAMEVGGIENLILNIAKSINRQKFELSVACLDSGGYLFREIQSLGCDGFILGRRPGLDIKLILRLAKIFRKNGYHVVHTHNQASHFYAGLASLVARTPVLVTTEHSRHYINSKYRRSLEKRILALITDKWIVVSNELLNATVSVDGIPAKKVVVIHNGVDVERFSEAKSEGIEYATVLRKELGIPNDAKIVIMVARLHPIKNHAVMLRAIAHANKIVSNIHAILVGDGELKKNLQVLSSRLGLNKNVHFLGYRQDIPNLMSISDVFVLCSKSEGLPLSLIEAMAAKVPVIITKSANKAELVRHGVNGIVVKNSYLAIAKALNELFGGRLNHNRLVENAYKFVRAKYSLDSMVKKYELIYEKLLSFKRTIM